MRKNISLFIFLISIVSTIYGLANSNLLSHHSWPYDLAWQAPLFCGIISILILAGWFLEKNRRLGFPAYLFALVSLVALFFFGAASIFALLSFALASFILGAALFKISEPESRPDTLSSLLLGLALFTLLFSWASPWKINSLFTHLSFLLAIFAVGALWLHEEIRNLVKVSKKSLIISKTPPLEAFLYAAVTLVFCLMLALASGPELSFDALLTHLYIPSYMEGHKNWYYASFHHVQANLPAAVDFLYAHFYFFSGEAGARLANVAALGLACYTIFRLGKTIASTNAALESVLLLLTTPLAALECSALFIENTLLLWITGSAYFIFGSRTSSSTCRWLGCCALGAAAMASKLHGAVAFGFLLIGLVIFARPWPKKKFMLFCGIALIFLVAGSYPYLRSWLETGNPVFPYYNDIFRSSAFPPEGLFDRRWIGRFNWRLFYNLTFSSSQFLEGDSGAAGLAGFLFLPFTIATVLLFKNRVAIGCLVIALCSIFVSSYNLQYLRYFYPLCGLLAVALAFSFDHLAKLIGLSCTMALVFLIAAINLYELPTSGPGFFFNIVTPFQTEKRLHLETRDAPEKLANRFLNRLGDAEKRVLYAESPAGAILEGTALYSSWHSRYFSTNSQSVRDAESAKYYLRDLNAQYVVQPKNPSSLFSKSLGKHLEQSGVFLGEFGNVKVFSIPPEKIGEH